MGSQRVRYDLAAEHNNTDKQGMNLSELPTLAPVFFLVSCRKKTAGLWDPGTHSPGCLESTLVMGSMGGASRRHPNTSQCERRQELCKDEPLCLNWRLCCSSEPSLGWAKTWLPCHYSPTSPCFVPLFYTPQCWCSWQHFLTSCLQTNSSFRSTSQITFTVFPSFNPLPYLRNDWASLNVYECSLSWYSPWTRSSGVIWEPERSTNSLALIQSYWTRISWGGDPEYMFNRPSRWFWHTIKCDDSWCRFIPDLKHLGIGLLSYTCP